MPKGIYKRNINGNKNPNWRGGRLTKYNGYIIQFCPDHPNCSKDGYILEHLLLMEKHIGRTLLPTEVVHHINGDNQDNRIENLMLFINQANHAKHEIRKRNKKGQFKKERKQNV